MHAHMMFSLMRKGKFVGGPDTRKLAQSLNGAHDQCTHILYNTLSNQTNNI